MNIPQLRFGLGLLCLAGYTQCADAATIYRCKTYSGVNYWSQNVCGKSNGVMIDMLTMPDGMSFSEQSRMADKVVQEREQKQSSADKEQDRARQCSAIDKELAEIWSNYKDGQHVPADKVGAHQTRTRELKRERTKLGCQTK